MKDFENTLLALEEATIGVNEINSKLAELIEIRNEYQRLLEEVKLEKEELSKTLKSIKKYSKEVEEQHQEIMDAATEIQTNLQNSSSLNHDEIVDEIMEKLTQQIKKTVEEGNYRKDSDTDKAIDDEEQEDDSDEPLDYYTEGASYEIVERDGRKMVEISFDTIPPEYVRNYMKKNYFGWSRKDRVWRSSINNLDIAEEICNPD